MVLKRSFIVMFGIVLEWHLVPTGFWLSAFLKTMPAFASWPGCLLDWINMPHCSQQKCREDTLSNRWVGTGKQIWSVKSLQVSCWRVQISNLRNFCNFPSSSVNIDSLRNVLWGLNWCAGFGICGRSGPYLCPLFVSNWSWQGHMSVQEWELFQLEWSLKNP